jgi:3-hydroxyisobutyrate dehydrogenase-like beta-hydroxyacid dehydrogenase
MATIAILSPGEMGSAVARRLRRQGNRVLTCVAERSEATVRRASEAGLECQPSLADVVRSSELIISLVTPSGAAPLAGRVAASVKRTGAQPLYVDGNSISPSTAKAIGAIITGAGAEFVDGGIIGGANDLDKATFHFSGARAAEVARIVDPAVHASVVGPEIGQASGLKILNAGLSKGLAALGVELLLCAQQLGLVPPIMERYREGRACVARFWEGNLPGLPPRAKRRAEEMQELTELMQELGLTAHTSLAAEQVLAMVAERYSTGQGKHTWYELMNAIGAQERA